MSLRKVWAELDHLVAVGVIERYAVCGAVGASFYIEPAATEDVDVFVARSEPSGPIVLAPGYAELLARGARPEGAHVVVAGWPLQILVAPEGLVAEGVRSARRFEVEEAAEPGREGVWVLPPEYLAAEALRVGRGKDLVRVAQLLDAPAFDRALFDELVARFELTGRWRHFRQLHLGEET